ncbi:MAG TPA: Gfo/Idh/MocA family oxidoreductase [Spirochaetota bacterium]|nr:Gfo/Idh/MocA family oxidoreductase [Spirochaetota bacterium]HOM38258.1 Gfo/Idh/MocA family oxidoreductase [Spirochaetota bacterium]HPQ48524.1 Gfo/Idh/MocA family oxidoreductase [Spirochaetota bacterium]
MIKCAVVGLGRIGWELSNDPKREKPTTHVECILSTEETELVAGCDIDSDKVEKFQKRFKINTYKNIDEMLNKEKIDILHIATPTKTHKEILIKAIDKNIPVIICEKPLTSNLKEAKKVLKKIKKSSSKLIVNYERRYSKDYKYVKEIIESKKYGELLSINGKLYIKTGSIKKALWHDATHLIDIIMFLTGENKIKLKNVLNNNKVLNLFFKSDTKSITIEISNLSDYLLFEVDLLFEKGRILVGNGIFKEYASEDSPFYTGFKSLIEKEIEFNKTEYFIGMFRDAIKSFKEKNYIPLSNIYTSYENIKIMTKIIKYL